MTFGSVCGGLSECLVCVVADAEAWTLSGSLPATCKSLCDLPDRFFIWYCPDAGAHLTNRALSPDRTDETLDGPSRIPFLARKTLFWMALKELRIYQEDGCSTSNVCDLLDVYNRELSCRVSCHLFLDFTQFHTARRSCIRIDFFLLFPGCSSKCIIRLGKREEIPPLNSTAFLSPFTLKPFFLSLIQTAVCRH